MTKYVSRTRDIYHIETNCGYGWESESEYNTYAEAKAALPGYREYISAYKGICRIVKRREKI